MALMLPMQVVDTLRAQAASSHLVDIWIQSGGRRMSDSGARPILVGRSVGRTRTLLPSAPAKASARCESGRRRKCGMLQDGGGYLDTVVGVSFTAGARGLITRGKCRSTQVLPVSGAEFAQGCSNAASAARLDGDCARETESEGRRHCCACWAAAYIFEQSAPIVASSSVPSIIAQVGSHRQSLAALQLGLQVVLLFYRLAASQFAHSPPQNASSARTAMQSGHSGGCSHHRRLPPHTPWCCFPFLQLSLLAAAMVLLRQALAGCGCFLAPYYTASALFTSSYALDTGRPNLCTIPGLRRIPPHSQLEPPGELMVAGTGATWHAKACSA